MVALTGIPMSERNQIAEEAGIFNTDPTGVTELSATGTVHVLASAVLFFSLLVSAWLVRGVFKRDPSWQWFSKAQLGFAVAYTAA